MNVFQSNGTVISVSISEVDSVTFTEEVSSGTNVDPLIGKSVILDNFERTEHMTASQNILAGTLDPTEGDGYWFAYASETGAHVYTYDSVGNKVDMVVGEKVYYGGIAEGIWGDSLRVVLDCRADTGSGGYWAAVSVPIAGAGNSLAELNGATTIQSQSAWNLSNLKSISIEGELRGAINLKMTGFTADDEEKSAVYSLETSQNMRESFVYTIPVSDLVPASWMGTSWSDIQTKVALCAFELNTEKSNYAELTLNSIILNFKDELSALDAFPFLR